RANHGVLIEEETTSVMTELILNERMEKYQTESSLTKPNTNDEMDIELSEEFFMKLPRRANHGVFIEEETTSVMTELILNERMEKYQTESSLAKPNTNDEMDIELSEEFFMKLPSNAYYETFAEDVVDHIAKVLEMLNLIKIPNVDFHRLRMEVFPLSLADDARQ
nr:hypothetical protein [Tanacetum cinerariifolium]